MISRRAVFFSNPAEAGIAFAGDCGITEQAMRHPALENLLILQDRDQRRINLEAQIAAVPGEIDAVRKKIAAERAANDDARTEVREFETQKKLIETEIGSAEGQVAKYRTQQSQVRKNDEYQALGHQIETTEKAIGQLEDQELAVMFAIDEGKRKFAAAEAVMKANIAGHESQIRILNERTANLTAELKTVQGEVATARGPIPEPSLRIYDRIASRQQPVCVPIHGGKCGGCHLKVSSESDADARKGDKLATCDQCGRIVWWEVG
jgi:predicted  nucleic acid-binding Zn-ribbon protein